MTGKQDKPRRLPGDAAFLRESLRGTEIEATYAGAHSFMRRKFTRELKGADVAVTGIPFDQAVTNRPGTRFGPEAIRKASEAARKNLTEIPRRGSTIPHPVVGVHGAGRVLLKPAAPGTGIIAGGVVRAILESAGIGDILSKCLGSTNPHNLVRATMNAIGDLRDASSIAAQRGTTVRAMFGMASADEGSDLLAERAGRAERSAVAGSHNSNSDGAA